MKKILSLILTLAAIIITLTSCAEIDGSGVATVVVEANKTAETRYVEYQINLSELAGANEGVYSLLKYLKDNENGFSYNISDSGYGAYVNSIAELVPDLSSGEFIALYTSESKDFAVATEWMPIVPELSYKGQVLKSSGVGISSMTVKNGTTVLFRLEKYTE